MAFSATLVEVTPHLLRYLIVQAGDQGAIDSIVIPNALGPTPDLRTDALTFGQSPMFRLVAKPVLVGAPGFADSALQLLGETRITPAGVNFSRGHLYLTPRNTGPNVLKWACITDEGSNAGNVASTGFGVIRVTGSVLAAQACYLEFRLQYSVDE